MSNLHNQLLEALEKYEQNQSFASRSLRFLFDDKSLSKALRQLDLDPKSDKKATEFEILQCCFEHYSVDQKRWGLTWWKLSTDYQYFMKTLFSNLDRDYLKNLLDILTQLYESNYLTKENLSTTKALVLNISSEQIPFARSAVFSLAKANLLTPANFDAAINKRTSFHTFSEMLKRLDRAKLLIQVNLDAAIQYSVKKRTSFCTFSEMLKGLDRAERLNQANLDAVMRYVNVVKDRPSLRLFSKTLKILVRAKLSTQANLDAIIDAITHATDLRSLFPILAMLDRGRCLHQKNLAQVLNPNNKVFIECYEYLQRLPAHLFTQAVFDDLIRYCQQEDTRKKIIHLVNQLIRGQANNTQINKSQSTHTASVHASVSDSAKKLWNRYGYQLSGEGLETIISAIKKEISKLSSHSMKNKAAKRCIKKITDKNYAFTDRTSRVTTRQLLALCYLAINDDENREGSRKDAMKQLINALHQIQRGYNLSARGVDHGWFLDDFSICKSGAFNKLIESQAGIHRDVNLNFITAEIASMKLNVVVKEEVEKHLNLDQKLANAEANKMFGSYIKQLNNLEEGIDNELWVAIKDQVAKRILDEFDSIYVKGSDTFNALIESGQCADLGPLVAKSRQKLENLPAYRDQQAKPVKKQTQAVASASFPFFKSEASSSPDSLEAQSNSFFHCYSRQ